MKTKHILTALALPAMFAACTADDIEGLNNGVQQMPERALLSENFVLNIENGVESRYQVNGTTGLEFVFEAGDSIGANCIDEPKWNASTQEWEEDPADWTILPYVNPALPFVKSADNEWKSAGRPGEGNYLFTNPYNPKDGGRLAAKFELPVVVQYDSKNPNAHIETYNKAIAADVLYEGEMAANLSLKNLYTYPKLRLHFDKNKEVTKVTKVVLEKTTGDGFIYQGGLDHVKIVDTFNPETIEDWLEARKADNVTEADYWAQVQTCKFIVDGVEDATLSGQQTTLANYAPASYTRYFFYEMNENAVSYGKTNGIEVRLMLPSVTNFVDDNTMKLYVCTDAGNFVLPLNASSIAWNEDKTLTAQKQQALWRNKANTLNINKDAWDDAPNTNFGNVVTTAEDWNKLVEKYGDLSKYAADTEEKDENGKQLEFVVSILSDKFALTSDLKMPEVAEFKINTSLSVEGNVTLKNIKVTSGTLTVKKGATLTTDPTLIVPTVKVEEGANLVFAAAYNEDNELVAYEKVTKVVNKGTVTVPAGVIAQFELENAKDAVVNVGAAAASRTAAEAVANLYGTNNGIINNYGIINTVDKVDKVKKTFVNNLPTEGISGAGYKFDDETKSWDGVPTINNYGTFNAKGETTNNGLFVNGNELTSSFVGNASFKNLTVKNQDAVKKYVATLDVKAGAKTYIDANAAETADNGLIVLADLKPTVFTIHEAKTKASYNNSAYGIVKYTLNEEPEDGLDLSESPVTYLVSNVNVELKKTWTYTTTGSTPTTERKALPVLEINGAVVVEVAAQVPAAGTVAAYYPASVEKLIVNSGKATIDGEIGSIANVEIKADAQLGIPAGATLKLGSEANVDTQTVAEAESAGVEAEENGVLAVNGTLYFDVENPTKDNGTDYAWYEGDTAKGVTLTENIVLHKGVKVQCKTKSDPTPDNKEAEVRTVTLTSTRLGEAYLTDGWNSIDGNDTYRVVIPSGISINMGDETKYTFKDDDTAQTEYKDKTNLDFKTILTNADEVELQGGSIIGLTKEMAIALNDLVVTKSSLIRGTDGLDILTVDKLTVDGGATLDIEGWLKINTTAVANQNCEAIMLEGKVNGVIAATNAASEYLFWDAGVSRWSKELVENKPFEFVNDEAGLISALNNAYCDVVIVEKDFAISKTIEIGGSKSKYISGNGKTKLSLVESKTAASERKLFDVKEGATLVLQDVDLEGSGYLVYSEGGNVRLNDVDATETCEQTGIECHGGRLEIIGGTYENTVGGAAYMVGTVDGCIARIENAEIGSTTSTAGGLTIHNSKAELLGCKLNSNSSASQWGLHVVASEVNYDSKTTYSGCYIQVYNEAGTTYLGKSIVNKAEFDGNSKADNFIGTKEQTEAKINELINN